MYIVAIGWAYVVLMMAVTASSIGKALGILVFLGVVPLVLFVLVFGKPRRRSMPLTDEISHQTDAADSHSDKD